MRTMPTTKLPQYRQDRLALIAICCIGLALRAYNLQASSLWCDELMQVMVASADWTDLFPLMTGYCSSPPLDYVIMKLVMLCFGTADWVLRMPACLFGAAAVPVFYCFARSVTERQTSLVAAVLLALSPFAIHYAQEARSYSLFLLLSLASYIAAVRLAEHGGFTRSLTLGAVNGLLLLAHYFGIFVIALEGVLLLAAAWRSKEKKRPTELLVLSMTVSFFLFLPWVPFMLLQFTVFGGKDLGYALSADMTFFKTLLASFAADKPHPDWLAYAYLLAYCAGAVIAWHKRQKKTVFVVLGLLAILGCLFGLSYFRKMVSQRNVIFLLPLFLLVCAYGMTSLLRLVKISGKLAVVLCMLLVLWPAAAYHRAGPKGHKQPWRAVAAYIRQHADGQEKIYITDPADRGFLAYYADPGASYGVIKEHWTSFRNDPSWKIWVINEAVLGHMKEKSFSGWVVAPSFVMSKPFSDDFFARYREILTRLLGPPVQRFRTQAGPLLLFHAKAVR